MIASKPIYVLTAQISAHLHFATEVANTISLISKNARAITARAGESCSSFIAITEFIEELAHTTIERSRSINTIAINISKISVDLDREESAYRNFTQVENTANDAPFRHSIGQAKALSQEKIQSFFLTFKELLSQLESDLGESWKQVRTADMLVSSSRVEASKSGDYRELFDTITANLQEAAQSVRSELKSAEKILRIAMRQLNESH